jgi:hypothetical protein
MFAPGCTWRGRRRQEDSSGQLPGTAFSAATRFQPPTGFPAPAANHRRGLPDSRVHTELRCLLQFIGAFLAGIGGFAYAPRPSRSSTLAAAARLSTATTPWFRRAVIWVSASPPPRRPTGTVTRAAQYVEPETPSTAHTSMVFGSFRSTLPWGTRQSARTCRESRQNGSSICGTDSFHQHKSLDGSSTFLYTERTVCRLNLASTPHGTRIPSVTR